MKSVSFKGVGKIREKTGKMFSEHSPRFLSCISACLSLICTLMLPTFLSDSTISFSNSIVSIAFAAVIYLLFRRYWGTEHCKREFVLTHIFGFMLSCMTAMGRAVDQTERFFPVSLLTCISILFYTHLFACIVSLIWAKLSEAESKRTAGNNEISHSTQESSPLPASGFGRYVSFAAEHPWIIAIALLLCWMPCFIALFPGGFSYDMAHEFNQQFVTYKSDFPRLHSVLIIGFMNAVHSLFGSYNAGIAIYDVLQMLAFSALFTHMLVTFYRQRIGQVMISMFAAYFALFPVIHLIVTHTGRDTLFSGLLTYLGFLLYRMACDTKAFFGTVRNPIILGTVLSLTLMARNNNSELIILPLFAVLNIVVWVKSHKLYPRGVLLFCTANIAVFVSLSFVLNLICQPITAINPRASMSIISQTLMRAYIDEPEKWTEKDNQDFEYYMNMEYYRYCPECADYSKNMMQNVKGAGNGVGFIKMWLRMGLKCPNSYLNAVTAQTRYMWYPDSVIDGYVRAELYKTEKSYFVTGVEKPGVRIPLFPDGEEFYRKIGKDISFEKIPVLSMLFSIGFQYWLLLNCLFYSVYKGRKKLYLPLGAMFVYLAFCFFIPIVLMRYFMTLFLFFPVTVVMTVQPGLASGSSGERE